MTLSAGTRLGPYEILDLLGTGGMGEVYRARDTKLGREVAIKVLPEELSREGERIARFEREARLLASLNHANVATLYGVEESSGRWCLVMELVGGETLSERIARGPIPVKEAIPLFRQVAAGLEAAHEKGILHRDLKPANIKVGPDGTIRILDFGLAKTLAVSGAATESSSAPTVTKGTALGVVLGTPAYMSPEQSRGEATDTRTDVWAFGCCLFEALSGEKPFRGATVTDVLASIARDEPAWSELPPAVPPPLRRLLKRCLSKDPSHRIRHIADAALELEEPSAGATLESRRPKASRWALLTLFAGAILGAALLWMFQPPPPSGGVARLQMTLPGPLAMSERPSLAISPDGSEIAFVAVESDRAQLYVRPIAAEAAHVVQGSDGASGPFFSADGRSLGFFAGNDLRRTDLSGASSQRITGTAVVTRGAWWASSGFIYLTPSNAHGVFRQAVTRSNVDMVSSPDPAKNEKSHSWPQVLPDEKAAVVTVVGLDSKSYESARIAILDLESGALATVLEGGYHARVTPSGHVLYMSSGNLMAAPFSLSRLLVTGPGKVVVTSVVSDARTGNAEYAIADDGTLVYAHGAPLHFAENRLVWVDRKGATERVTESAQVFRWPRLSPDGTHVALSIEGPSDDVWVLELARGTLTRVTFESRNFAPLWTPDGRDLVFSSIRTGIPQLWSKRADGSGEARPFVELAHASFPGAWTSDGRLVFTSGSVLHDVWVASRGDSSPEPLLDSRFGEMAPVFSPDGRWLAFASDESGSSQIYVQPFPGPGGKTPVSTDGGAEPMWAHSGKELFYRNGDKMMAVRIEVDPSLRIGAPVTLFEGGFEPSVLPGLTNYDVSLDDQRFLMLEPVPQPEGPHHLEVVLDFFDELKRLVPKQEYRSKES